MDGHFLGHLKHRSVLLEAVVVMPDIHTNNNVVLKGPD